ncbi:histidine-rich glycoprotein-like, partial [Pollicipes pollicipes]|uniref:histidine-rich glycoprotein-like n=1 Tax=Pollicipes pollicipes TaxID=41117 RepID=UPI001884B87B
MWCPALGAALAALLLVSGVCRASLGEETFVMRSAPFLMKSQGLLTRPEDVLALEDVRDHTDHAHSGRDQLSRDQQTPSQPVDGRDHRDRGQQPPGDHLDLGCHKHHYQHIYDGHFHHHNQRSHDGQHHSQRSHDGQHHNRRSHDDQHHNQRSHDDQHHNQRSHDDQHHNQRSHDDWTLFRAPDTTT